MCWRILFHLGLEHLSVGSSLVLLNLKSSLTPVGRMRTGQWGGGLPLTGQVGEAQAVWRLALRVKEGVLGDLEKQFLLMNSVISKLPSVALESIEETVVCLAKQLVELFFPLFVTPSKAMRWMTPWVLVIGKTSISNEGDECHSLGSINFEQSRKVSFKGRGDARVKSVASIKHLV